MSTAAVLAQGFDCTCQNSSYVPLIGFFPLILPLYLKSYPSIHSDQHRQHIRKFLVLLGRAGNETLHHRVDGTGESPPSNFRGSPSSPTLSFSHHFMLCIATQLSSLLSFRPTSPAYRFVEASVVALLLYFACSLRYFHCVLRYDRHALVALLHSNPS